MLGTMNQNIHHSDTIGGSIKVFEGRTWPLVGGFQFDLATLPDNGNVLPIGTPVFCDEEKRTIAPCYTFEVAENISTTTLKVKRGIEGTRAKVGMYIMIAPTAIGTKGKSVTIKAVKSLENGIDELTLSEAIEGANKGVVMIEADRQHATDAKVKVVPNALLKESRFKAPGATQVNGDGIWMCEYPVLEKRIPPIPACIKAALVAGQCYVRFSNRK